MRDKFANIKKYKNKIYHGNCFDFMRQVPWDKTFDLKAFWEQIHRISKENSPTIIFSAQPFTIDLILSNRKNFRYSLIWNKVLPVGFLHKNIDIFYRKLPNYNPIKSTGHERKIVKNRKQNKRGTRKNTLHPTQKLIELIRYLLKLYIKEDCKVFDPFMGSGTTAIVCKSMGIDFWGMRNKQRVQGVFNFRNKHEKT